MTTRSTLLSRAALLAFTLIAAAPVVACSGASTAPTAVAPPGPPSSPPTTKAQIAPTDDDEGGPATEVFERAKLAMESSKWRVARMLFDRVAAAERAEATAGASPSPMARAAAYNAALCSEQLDDALDARDRFQALSIAAEGSTDAIDALLRRGRLDVELEDWTDLSQSASALLARTDLVPADRAEGLALQAIALVEAKELPTAEKDVAAAQKLLYPQGDDTPAPPQGAAAYWFAKGEVIRAKGALISLNPPPPDFGVKMESRCQAILDAEDAYVEAIKTTQLRWAVRAGVRVASLYIALHADLVAIPPPKSATTDAKKDLFRGAMSLRYRILLEKGLGTLEHTLNLEPTTGVKSAWFARAREARDALTKELESEKASLKKLPYSEEQLQKALDELSKPDAKSKS
ncbi:MAG: hypothetical protein ABI175_18625 [Polyangiales bacterium]